MGGLAPFFPPSGSEKDQCPRDIGETAQPEKQKNFEDHDIRANYIRPDDRTGVAPSRITRIATIREL